ncbi:MAG TPA: class I SAM-dependent methyltransferase family protein, partial [Thermoplasmatales archaeon]|nr:class I SAM-dependent methyltransferase family protein [Thermoplasmatales archaeon]
VHVENHVRYKLDPSKIMFSSGNMSERIKMSTIADENETVVDMFAGIGYFSIPIAVYSTPKKVYAIEMNPTAYHYLCSNITLNSVNHIVKPLLGDNREVTPKGVADRVIMGYLRETYRYLPTAFASLRNTGVIHYHEVCPNELLETRPFQRIKEAAKQFSLRITDVKKRIIKSYAPGVSHVVLDVNLERS